MALEPYYPRRQQKIQFRSVVKIRSPLVHVYAAFVSAAFVGKPAFALLCRRFQNDTTAGPWTGKHPVTAVEKPKEEEPTPIEDPKEHGPLRRGEFYAMRTRGS